jgi:tellurium resistance protein TerZ
MAISLVKGQKISLKKEDNTPLVNFCVGANWGVIEKKGFFGIKKVAVDLDLSAILIGNREFKDVVYYGNLKAQGVEHSGDDLVGDIDGDDGLDNEVIEVNLNKLDPDIDQIFFVLNSYKKQDFATIPFASIRLYEGKPDIVKKVFAKFNVAKDPKFAGYVSLILGKLYKRNGEWKFSAIGEPIKARDLKTTIEAVLEKFI